KGDGARTFTEEAKSGAVEKYVVVQPPEGRHYDTLWGISERYLGDGMRYKEILHLNRGVVQPDGTALQNPDLIYPGWVLRLPGDATGPGLMESNKSPEQPAKTGASTDKTQGADQATGDKSGSTADHAGTAANGGGPGGVTESDSVNASAVTAGGFGAGGALLAAGLLFGLRRRRGWDGGPNPRGGKKLDSEFDLRENADESSAYFLDKVLRGVTNSVPEQGTLPAPTSCVLGADGLALTFPADARVRLDAPWKGEPGGRAWGISRADARELPKSSGLSPLPGLVPVGHSGQGLETLLDIESISGITSLSGDLDVARDVAVSMGLGLATSKWTDLPRVTFIGFADDLSELAPDSIRHYDDLSELFERLEARRRRQHNACAAHGYDSVLTGRLADSDERLWSPEFVVLSGVPNEDDVNRLASLAADPRNSVGVIVVGDVIDAPVRMVASSEGRLWCGPLGIDVVAHRMTAETYRDALGIFDAEIVRGGASDPSGPDTPAGGIAAPVVDPDALDLTQPMPVEISTLGDVHVSAPGEVDDGRRQLLTEILVFLALHPEGIHPNVLAGAVWPRGVEDDVRDAALAQAATWVG
ncbi:MAG: LysM peptidoglycan-binding domain-containing protein, partial [Nocardioidaceae bacterium]